MLRAVPRLLLALAAGILLIAVFVARSTVEPTPGAAVVPVVTPADTPATARDVPLLVCDAWGRPVEGAIARVDDAESSVTSAQSFWCGGAPLSASRPSRKHWAR